MLEEHILKLLKLHYGFKYSTKQQGADSTLVVEYENDQYNGCFTLQAGRTPSGLSLVKVHFSDNIEHMLLMSSAADTIAKLIVAYA